MSDDFFKREIFDGVSWWIIILAILGSLIYIFYYRRYGQVSSEDIKKKKEPIDNRVYDAEGFDEQGYDKSGYNKAGYNKDGFNRQGYDRYGYDKDGYDSEGRGLGDV